VIPGNHPIEPEQIQSRIEQFHKPYHDAIDAVLDKALATDVTPMVFSIHSFTPNWKGIARPWHAAILWDSDPRLNTFMIEGMRLHDDIVVGDNEPYDGALRNDTMYRHCTKRGLAHSLLEVRQDLIADDSGVQRWADIIAPLLEMANLRSDMHEIKHFGSRTD